MPSFREGHICAGILLLTAFYSRFCTWIDQGGTGFVLANVTNHGHESADQRADQRCAGKGDTYRKLPQKGTLSAEQRTWQGSGPLAPDHTPPTPPAKGVLKGCLAKEMLKGC